MKSYSKRMFQVIYFYSSSYQTTLVKLSAKTEEFHQLTNWMIKHYFVSLHKMALLLLLITFHIYFLITIVESLDTLPIILRKIYYTLPIEELRRYKTICYQLLTDRKLNVMLLEKEITRRNKNTNSFHPVLPPACNPMPISPPSDTEEQVARWKLGNDRF